MMLSTKSYYFIISQKIQTTSLCVWRSNFVNLWMKNSLVIYVQKIKSMKSAENYIDHQSWKLIIFIFAKKLKRLPCGFKNQILWSYVWRLLCYLRPKKKDSWIQLKITEIIIHENLFFIYFAKNSHNSLMSLKLDFMIFSLKNSLIIYEQTI